MPRTPERLGPAADSTRSRLLALIDSGALRAGARLGGERELALELGVSRSTVRVALASLEEQGVVQRVTGRAGGTFVTQGKVERDLSRIVGVPELLRDQGFTAGTRVVDAAMRACDEKTARALRLETGALVIEVVRLRLADAAPISLEHARFPAYMFPNLLDQSLSGSLYDLLAQQYDERPVRTEERIEVGRASVDEAAVLEVATGSPLLVVERTSWDGAARPIEFSTDLFRADRTRIVVRTPSSVSGQNPGVAFDVREQARR